MASSRPPAGDGIPVLSDGSVLLRAPVASDVASMTEVGYEPADPAAHLSWTIVQPPSDRWCGTVTVAPDGHGAAAIDVFVGPESRRQGIATRALRLVAAWGFTTLGMQVISGQVAVGNEAARRAAIRAGFRVPDVVMRRALLIDGQRQDSWVADLIPADLQHSRGDDAHLGKDLTRRERDVLGRLTRGESNRAIAATLGISENTVKNHVGSILEKLQAASRSEAVVIGLRQGLTTLDN